MCGVFLALARDAPTRRTGPAPGMFAALSVFRTSGRAWALTLFYFMAFGGFVAMFLYLPKLLTAYTTSARPTPAPAPPASHCSPSSAAPPVGWLSDASAPPASCSSRFIAVAVLALVLAATYTAIVPLTVACLTMAVALGLGTGAVFKLVPEWFPTASAPSPASSAPPAASAASSRRCHGHRQVRHRRLRARLRPHGARRVRLPHRSPDLARPAPRRTRARRSLSLDVAGVRPPREREREAFQPSARRPRGRLGCEGGLRAGRCVARPMRLAGEERRAERSDDEAGERGGDDRCALGGGEDLVLQADRDDGGGHAELCAGDEGGRHALALSRAARRWTATLRVSRATASRRTDGCSISAPSCSRAPRTTKNSGTKNPSATPRTCVNSRFGRTERGHEQTGAESRDQHAGPALLGDPRQREQDQEGEAQIERPPALLRALAKAMGPALWVDPVSHHVHRDGAGGHERTALGRVEHPVGLEHQRDRQDRDDIGDRDLPDHDQRLPAGEASLRDHREDRGPPTPSPG
jgi:hypothetical protein